MALTFDTTENPDSVLFPTEGGLYINYDVDADPEYGALTDLPAGTIYLGIVSEDGIEESYDSSTTDHKGWQGNRKYRTTVDDGSVTLALSLSEYTDASRRLFFGVAKNSTTGGWHFSPTRQPERLQAFVIGYDVATGTVVKKWYPDARLTSRDARTFNGTDPAEFAITLQAYERTIAGQSSAFVEWTAQVAAEDEGTDNGGNGTGGNTGGGTTNPGGGSSSALSFSPNNLTPGTVGENYAKTITVNGGVGNHNFTVSPLPNGFGGGQTGTNTYQITAPAAAIDHSGFYGSFTISAVDQNGSTAPTKQYDIGAF